MPTVPAQLPSYKSKSLGPVADTYYDVEGLIASVVRAFRAKYGHYNNANLSDMMSDAKVAYMEAYRSYDKSKGDFSKRVSSIVWHRLQDKARNAAKRKPVAYITACDMQPDAEGNEVMSLVEDKIRFNVRMFTQLLSDDAAYIVHLVFKFERLRYRLTKNVLVERPMLHRRALVILLRKQKWTGDRIANAFEEIGNALAA